MATFTAMVANVCDELNYTSAEATTRVGKRINGRYRQVLSSLGLDTSKITEIEVAVDPAHADFDDLPDLLVEGLEKVLRVQLVTDSPSSPIRLEELTYDEVTAAAVRSSTPRAFAVKRMASGEVTITLDGFPAVEEFTLKVEGYENTVELSGSVEPLFSADFHDILEEGAKADERRKMEKFDMAAEHEQAFEQRLSDLKMYIAKSGYLDKFQGKTKETWWKTGYDRTRFYWPR